MKEIRDQTACFTGHRRIPAEQVGEICEHLNDAIVNLIERGYCFFCAGGALGFDTLAAQAVIAMKKQYPYIRLILVLPCFSQAKNWNEYDRMIYERIKSQADKVVYTGQEYTKDCMHRRDRYLVDNSSACICYLTERIGGTAYTVDYARRQGLEVIYTAYAVLR